MCSEEMLAQKLISQAKEAGITSAAVTILQHISDTMRYDKIRES